MKEGYLNIKFYTWDGSLVEDLKRILKKKLNGKYTLVNLPKKKRKITLRTGPSGRGYSTYRKYGLILRRGLIRLKDLNLMNVMLKCVSIPGIYLNTSIES